MSWDVFVSHLPPEARTLDDVPDDFQPPPLGSKAEVLSRLDKRFPALQWQDDHACLQTPAGSVDISLGRHDPVLLVSLHARGDDGVTDLVRSVVEVLGGRGVDPSSPTGFLDGGEGWKAWKAYRDRVLP